MTFILMNTTSTHTHTHGYAVVGNNPFGFIKSLKLIASLEFPYIYIRTTECLWTICYLLVPLLVLISQTYIE